jgi:hypothetical protein
MWARAGPSYGEPVSTPIGPATFFQVARKKGCLFALFAMIALACGAGWLVFGPGPDRPDETPPPPPAATSTTHAPASATAKPGAPTQPGGPAVPGEQ